MTVETAPDIDALYRGRKGRIDVVDVPELGHLVLEGRGGPAGADFDAAFATLIPVAHATRLLLRSEGGPDTRVMPPEAAFWVDGATPWELDRAPVESWHWKVMVMQPDPIDAALVERALHRARDTGAPGIERVAYERWTEGPSAQTIHVGPYDAEGPTVERLHRAIAATRARPRLWHHEIYFSDPYRTPPAKYRTLIRQPVDRPPHSVSG